MPPGGVHITKTLTMQLDEKGSRRLQWELIALAVIGTVSLVMTFLTMFTPLCSAWTVVLVSVAVLLFFSVHAALPEQTHYSLLIFLLLYAVFFYWKREALAAGMMHLMNAVYQAIFFTDWKYFTTDPGFDQARSATMSLCFAMVPITWLISYAVVRFKNFFLSLLVTLPFVEIGFYFGIVPDHAAAAGLVAFWCGSLAAGFAAGKRSHGKKSPGGFTMRKHRFLPLHDLKHLMPERAGILTAMLIFVLCMAAEGGIRAAHYERPEKIKDMRTEFQYYAASIDWSDIRTVFPFLKDKNTSEPEETVELGRNDRREFDDQVVSHLTMDALPLGRLYLKFGTYQHYAKSRWRAADPEALPAGISAMFDATELFPPEFLGYTVQTLAYQTAEMELTDSNAALEQCIPYGFAEDDDVLCRGDLTAGTKTTRYRVFAGENYENLLLRTVSFDVPAGSQIAASPPDMQDALRSFLAGREETLVQFPQDPALGAIYYGTEAQMQHRAAAAVISAAGYTDYVFDTCTELPDIDTVRYLERMFGDLTDGFDARNATPAERMILMSRLRDRRCANVEYSLAPGKTPPGEDYVLYFLAESKCGFCTHYATTGTLLARLAGIPARYCEGYLVDNTALHPENTSDGFRYSCDILDSNAHAWTEIYLDGFGWIPFEFTFSYFTPPELPTEPETVPEESEPVTQDPTEPVPLTEIVTEFVPVVPQTEVVPTEVAVPAISPARLRGILLTLLMLLLIAGGVFFVIERHRRVISRRELLLADPIGDGAARYAWELILQRLTDCGVNTQAGSTDAFLQEMLEKCEELLTDEELGTLLAIGTKLRYSPHSLKETERDAMIGLYRKLNAQLYDRSDPIRKLWLRWFRNYL